MLWVTKMGTYGKYEVPFVLENYEDPLIRSNVGQCKFYVLSFVEISHPFTELY